MSTSPIPPTTPPATGSPDPAAQMAAATQPAPVAPFIAPKDETEAQKAQRIFQKVVTETPDNKNILPAIRELITKPKPWWMFFAKSNSQLFLQAEAIYERPAEEAIKHGNDPKYQAQIAKEFERADQKAAKILKSLAKGMPKEARERTLAILTEAAKAGGQSEAMNDHAIILEKLYITLAKDLAPQISDLSKATDGEKKAARTKIETTVAKATKGMPPADAEAMTARLVQTNPDMAKQIADANPSFAQMALKQATDTVKGIPGAIATEVVGSATTGLPLGATGLIKSLIPGGGTRIG